MRFASPNYVGAAKAAAALLLFALVRPDAAFAYLGPGAGLGMVGTLISVVVAILVAILGVFLYPVRLYRKWRKNNKSR